MHLMTCILQVSKYHKDSLYRFPTVGYKLLCIYKSLNLLTVYIVFDIAKAGEPLFSIIPLLNAQGVFSHQQVLLGRYAYCRNNFDPCFKNDFDPKE